MKVLWWSEFMVINFTQYTSFSFSQPPLRPHPRHSLQMKHSYRMSFALNKTWISKHRPQEQKPEEDWGVVLTTPHRWWFHFHLVMSLSVRSFLVANFGCSPARPSLAQCQSSAINKSQCRRNFLETQRHPSVKHPRVGDGGRRRRRSLEYNLIQWPLFKAVRVLLHIH